MSVAVQARMLDAQEPVGALASAIEAMIVIQMAAYPDSWTEEERREMAELHLFGERDA